MIEAENDPPTDGSVPARTCCSSASARRMPAAATCVVGLLASARCTASSSVRRSVTVASCADASDGARLPAPMTSTLATTAAARARPPRSVCTTT